MSKEIRKKLITGEIDPNNTDLFFGDVIKATISFLNNNIKLRDKRIPHYIMNTGDEIMYRELMGYEYSKTEVTDENFIYNEVPRCMVNVSEMQTVPDQLTQPYVRGVFDVEYDDNVYEFSAEIKRMPIHMTVSLKYYVDSFTDSLALSQYLITNLSYIRTFRFVYMGNEISASITFPDSHSVEKPETLQFDSESRYKTVGIDLQLDTNLPIFDVRTCVESSAIITKTDNNIGRKGSVKDKARKYRDDGTEKPRNDEEVKEDEEVKSLGKARRLG